MSQQPEPRIRGGRRVGAVGGRDDQGAAVVELALILPVLMLLVVGAVRFGVAFNAKIEMSGAAREAARWLVVHPSDSAGAVTRAQQASPGLALTSAEIAITGLCTAGGGGPVTVTISRQYSLEVPFLPLPTPTVPVTGIGQMSC